MAKVTARRGMAVGLAVILLALPALAELVDLGYATGVATRILIFGLAAASLLVAVVPLAPAHRSGSLQQIESLQMDCQFVDGRTKVVDGDAGLQVEARKHVKHRQSGERTSQDGVS